MPRGAGPGRAPAQAPALGSCWDQRRDGGSRGRGSTQKGTSPRLGALEKDSPEHVIAM